MPVAEFNFTALGSFKGFMRPPWDWNNLADEESWVPEEMGTEYRMLGYRYAFYDVNMDVLIAADPDNEKLSKVHWISTLKAFFSGPYTHEQAIDVYWNWYLYGDHNDSDFPSVVPNLNPTPFEKEPYLNRVFWAALGLPIAGNPTNLPTVCWDETNDEYWISSIGEQHLYDACVANDYIYPYITYYNGNKRIWCPNEFFPPFSGSDFLNTFVLVHPNVRSFAPPNFPGYSNAIINLEKYKDLFGRVSTDPSNVWINPNLTKQFKYTYDEDYLDDIWPRDYPAAFTGSFWVLTNDFISQTSPGNGYALINTLTAVLGNDPKDVWQDIDDYVAVQLVGDKPTCLTTITSQSLTNVCDATGPNLSSVTWDETIAVENYCTPFREVAMDGDEQLKCNHLFFLFGVNRTDYIINEDDEIEYIDVAFCDGTGPLSLPPVKTPDQYGVFWNGSIDALREDWHYP